MEFTQLPRTFFLLTLLCLTAVAPAAAAGHEEHDEEHEEEHEHHLVEGCGSTVDPSHEILEILNVTEPEVGEPEVGLPEVQELVEHILERFDCEHLQCQCITASAVLTSAGVAPPIKESNLSAIYVVLLHQIHDINATCGTNAHTTWRDWWFADILKDGHPHELEEFIEELEHQAEKHEEHEEHEEHEGEEHEGEEHEGHEEEGHEEEGHHHEGEEEKGHHEEEEEHHHGEESNQTKCFDAKSVMTEAGIGHGDVPTDHQRESVAGLIVMYLLKGYQIGECPPDNTDFLDGIWMNLGLHGDEALMDKEFDSLLTKLNIGKSTSDGHTDHGAEAGEEEAGHEGHDHRRKRQAVEQAPVSKCYSGAELLGLYGVTAAAGVHQADLVKMCPALIQQQISGLCAEPHSEHGESMDDKAKRVGVGFVCIILISLGSLFGIIIIPCLSPRTQLYVMCPFIGLAVGTLAADALLHLVPEALGVHNHDAHAHAAGEHTSGPHVEPFFWKALLVVGGIWAFFVIESLLSLIGGSHHHQHHGPEHHEMEQGEKYKSDDQKLDEKAGCCDVKPVAWMIILGDGVHNLADGLAVGAAFSLSMSSGVATSIAIFCHEVPHEVGDFAVLLNSGMSYCKAAFFNFVSALTAVLGYAIAIAVSTDDETRRWFFTLAAGMFLYIALSVMVPELVSMKSGLQKKRAQWFACFLLQNLGILLGVVFMVLISLYEEDLRSITV